MQFTQIPLGPLQANAYVLYNDNKEALIFDPGGEGNKLNQWLKEEKIRPLAILLTHAHFDHIGAVDEVRNEWNIPVYLHENEQDWLSDPHKNGSAYFFGTMPMILKRADHLLTKEGKLTIGPFTLQVYETPGHSPGSVSYYVAEKSVVFSGDALFMGSIGRTDLYGGDYGQLMQSIREKLLTLPEETVVASGHGPLTTIGHEMDTNPFLNGF